MGIFDLFESAKTKTIAAPEAFPGAARYRKDIAGAAKPGALKRLGRAGETYPGPLMAALSEFEEMGLAGLKDWLGSEMPTEGALYGAAEEEIMKTLSGESYDPVHGEYYQAYRTQIQRELAEAKDRLAARASAGDKLFGGGRRAVEGEMEESALGQMALILGQLQERERERRLGAVGQALQFTRYGEEAPLTRIAASQQFGALPREIEQAGMDADYQEWMRALNDLGISLDVATGLATYQPGYRTETEPGGLKTLFGTIPWEAAAAGAKAAAAGSA